MGKPERRRAVEQYKADKKGFFGIDDPGPCLAPTEPKPAAAGDESSTDVCSDRESDSDSDDAGVWWHQTWYRRRCQHSWWQC